MTWTDHAACHPSRRPEGMTRADWVEVFFPERGTFSVEPARRVCASCPVVAECRAVADPVYGVWAGMTGTQRRRAGRPRRAKYGPEHFDRALRMFEQGYGHAEIASATGATTRTVRYWIARAKEQAA